MRFLFIFFLMCGSVSAAEKGVDALEQFHQKVTSLQGEFVQVLLDADANKVQESSGLVWIKRPGLFRWEYNKPYPQIIVADGNRIWIYDPELEQVTVRKEEDAIGSAPALVLSGRHPLNKDFNIKELNRNDGYAWVSLTPKKEDADFSEIAVAFKGKVISVLELKDKLGQRTKIIFKGLKINALTDESRFKFVIPPGTDVIGADPPQ
ncbi:MAG: outer membrane lipoprotein chaperone LolA [Gammaproteobacteria bacterium]|nr:outer membrane lipoprotein chaperone LolA [Gammaproteobacteria bacterium]